MKHKTEEEIKKALTGAGRIEGLVHIDFKWYEPNRNRDKDNVAFAKKFILDALVSSQVISSDDWKGLEGFTDSFYIDAKNPRVELVIKEATNEHIQRA